MMSMPSWAAKVARSSLRICERSARSTGGTGVAELHELRLHVRPTQSPPSSEARG